MLYFKINDRLIVRRSISGIQSLKNIFMVKDWAIVLTQIFSDHIIEIDLVSTTVHNNIFYKFAVNLKNLFALKAFNIPENIVPIFMTLRTVV